MAAAYSEAVRLRCREPRRAGGWPDGEAGVGTGSTGSLDAGVWTRLQVQGTHGVIDDARFRVFGCSAAVASASFVADAIVGATPDAVRALDARVVADALALPPEKQAMAAMAIDAAHAAVDDWERKAGLAGRNQGFGVLTCDPGIGVQ